MQCPLKGVTLNEIPCHRDERGWLVELFRQDELENSMWPVMGYVSMTNPGVTRGPHEHREQTDMFCFLGTSSFRLYLWDNRKTADTYQQFWHMDVPSGQYVFVAVPPGVVHAYRNTGSADGLVFNAPNRLYAGPGKSEPVDEIRHEDDPHSPFVIPD